MAGNGNLKPLPADPGFRGCGSWGFLLQMPSKICSESLSVALYVWPDGWGLLQILPQAQRDGTILKNVLSGPRTCQVFFGGYLAVVSCFCSAIGSQAGPISTAGVKCGGA